MANVPDIKKPVHTPGFIVKRILIFLVEVNEKFGSDNKVII